MYPSASQIALAFLVLGLAATPVASAQYTDCEGQSTSDPNQDACAKSEGVMDRLTTVLTKIGAPLFLGAFLVSLVIYGVSTQDERRRSFAVSGMKTTAIALGAILSWSALFATWNWIFA